MSNTIVYVRNNSLRDVPNGIEYPPESNGLRIVPDLKGRHSLNFYIRIPVQDCNQHRHYIFRYRLAVTLNMSSNKMIDIVWICTHVWNFRQILMRESWHKYFFFCCRARMLLDKTALDPKDGFLSAGQLKDDC